MRDVVITGMGAVSGSGYSPETIWGTLFQGKTSGLMPIHPEYHFDPDILRANSSKHRRRNIPRLVSGVPANNVQLGKLLGDREARRYSRTQLLAGLAAKQAIEAAHLDMHDIAERFGYAGAITGGDTAEAFAITQAALATTVVLPTEAMQYMSGILPNAVKNRYRLHGPYQTEIGLCGASMNAIISALRIIRNNEADAMLCVGSSATITPAFMTALAQIGLITDETKTYQQGRVGFHVGEGAAALILEAKSHAEDRRAKIYAHIAGYGIAGDGEPGSALTQPSQIWGNMRAAKRALGMAGIQARKIGYVNSHGTGTPTGDVAELASINDWTDRQHPPYVSSTKPLTGHLFGAAGIFESMLTVQMLNHKIWLPTHGISTSFDSRCEFPGVRHLLQATPHDSRAAMKITSGFGGIHAALIFTK